MSIYALKGGAIVTQSDLHAVMGASYGFLAGPPIGSSILGGAAPAEQTAIAARIASAQGKGPCKRIDSCGWIGLPATPWRVVQGLGGAV